MLEVLQFIFSSPWIFCGSVVLLVLITAIFHDAVIVILLRKLSSATQPTTSKGK